MSSDLIPMLTLLEVQKENELRKTKTNHILHILLCLPTAGFWIIVWIIIGIVNVCSRGDIETKYRKKVDALTKEQK